MSEGRLLRGGALVDDTFALVGPGDPLPEGDVAVPFARLCAEPDLCARGGRLGVVLEPEDDVRALTPHLPRLALVCLRFPSFREGRPFTQARLLRDELGFAGALRAIGAVSRDRVYFMRRCGIDELLVPESEALGGVLSALESFSAAYQPGARGTGPAWRRFGARR